MSDTYATRDTTGPGGLKPAGVVIYKKLLKKGFPATRALAFARRAQDGAPGHKTGGARR